MLVTRDVAESEADDAVAYAIACADLIQSLKDGCFMADGHVFTLLDAERTMTERKQLVVGLKAAGLISEDHAEAAFALWPMLGA